MVVNGRLPNLVGGTTVIIPTSNLQDHTTSGLVRLIHCVFLFVFDVVAFESVLDGWQKLLKTNFHIF